MELITFCNPWKHLFSHQKVSDKALLFSALLLLGKFSSDA